LHILHVLIGLVFGALKLAGECQFLEAPLISYLCLL
jgi:hypothetical protein